MKNLLEKYKEISTLGEIGGLLGWDTEVNLPPKGAPERGEQQALITGIIVDKWHDLEFQKLIKNLSPKNKYYRPLNHSLKIYTKIPKKILVKDSKLTSKAFVVWHEAKKDNNFKSFAPILEELVILAREEANYLGFKDNIYDALLDLYEPGLTTSFCKNIFDKLTPELTHIIKEITAGNDRTNSLKKVKLPILTIEKQKELNNFILEKMGYDFSAGRVDTAPHPFETTLGPYDIRITNRYNNTFIESLTGAMHEGGHALYEQGVDKKLADTPLAHGISLGIHESQSRFWENIIGRSKEFSEFLSYELKVKPDDLYRELNKVKPSFIRVESDEVTYNLHIAIRFEIEEMLLNGKIKVNDLPSVWNEKMKKYLGITPKSDSEGVLQDVHWSHNSFGYFPTYTLGNLYAAQWRSVMLKEIKNFKSLVKKGDFEPILDWLRKNIHVFGKTYYPDELSVRVSGEVLNPQYFLDYLKEKYL